MPEILSSGGISAYFFLLLVPNIFKAYSDLINITDGALHSTYSVCTIYVSDFFHISKV